MRNGTSMHLGLFFMVFETNGMDDSKIKAEHAIV